MTLTWAEHELVLTHPFTIARGSSASRRVVVVNIEHDGIVGLGEAAPISRYGETVDTVQAFFRTANISGFADPFSLDAILDSVEASAHGNTAAKAAIDIALHDWIGKKLGLPLWKYWGLDPTRCPLTSFTIGIDRPEKIEEKVREAEEFPILKIKLGGADDAEIIAAVRRATKKTIRVDANEGWKDKSIAVEKIKWLEQEGVEFVEQPLPASDLAGTAWVRERVKLPLIADENSLRLRDIPTLMQAFDGINIKLMKCTGLREAKQMIHTARACGMKVMIGCMIETSVGVTAGAHLTPLVDYADLDGSILTKNDPYRGATFHRGRIGLPSDPGLGVERR
jgi:L-alanine-DL-glutamate epimerase-like enolase superfamily enzyme